jgi:hypothetical protein
VYRNRYGHGRAVCQRMILYIKFSKIEKFPAGCAPPEVFDRRIWKSSKFVECGFLAFANCFVVSALYGKFESLGGRGFWNSSNSQTVATSLSPAFHFAPRSSSASYNEVPSRIALLERGGEDVLTSEQPKTLLVEASPFEACPGSLRHVMQRPIKVNPSLPWILLGTRNDFPTRDLNVEVGVVLGNWETG